MKSFLRKLPVFRNVYGKFKAYDIKINGLEQQIQCLSANLISQKHIEKSKRGEKVNLVFVCHRPQVWNSLKTVFEACNADEMFNVTIVAIPFKKQLPKTGFNHEFYETEGAEEFWKDYPCKVVNGYNYETKEWLDIRTLNPDYVFFQQPYNVCKPECLKSWNVAKYATLVFVHYGLNTCEQMKYEALPQDFFKNLGMLFCERVADVEIYDRWKDKTGNIFTRLFLTGYPRFDLLKLYENAESPLWKKHDTSLFRIVWTPRWTTNENNCHFFKYKDDFLDYCDRNKDVDFVFRPHPQAWLNYAQFDHFSIEKSNQYKTEYQKRENANIDETADFLPLFYSSDVLVTDFSSVVIEYFLTGKPIVYCKNDKSLFEQTDKWTEGFYYVHSWKELADTLEMLKRGEDPLKEKRQELIRSEFYLPPNGAGYEIKELIKKDFRGEL